MKLIKRVMLWCLTFGFLIHFWMSSQSDSGIPVYDTLVGLAVYLAAVALLLSQVLDKWVDRLNKEEGGRD